MTNWLQIVIIKLILPKIRPSAVLKIHFILMLNRPEKKDPDPKPDQGS